LTGESSRPKDADRIFLSRVSFRSARPTRRAVLSEARDRIRRLAATLDDDPETQARSLAQSEAHARTLALAPELLD